MSVDCFLDSNILVYAVTGDEAEKNKREYALALIETEYFALSAQVLQEFYMTVTRKIKSPLTAGEAFEWVEQLAPFPCVSIDSRG